MSSPKRSGAVPEWRLREMLKGTQPVWVINSEVKEAYAVVDPIEGIEFPISRMHVPEMHGVGEENFRWIAARPAGPTATKWYWARVDCAALAQGQPANVWVPNILFEEDGKYGWAVVGVTGVKPPFLTGVNPRNPPGKV